MAFDLKWKGHFGKAKYSKLVYFAIIPVLSKQLPDFVTGQRSGFQLWDIKTSACTQMKSVVSGEMFKSKHKPRLERERKHADGERNSGNCSYGQIDGYLGLNALILFSNTNLQYSTAFRLIILPENYTNSSLKRS